MKLLWLMTSVSFFAMTCAAKAADLLEDSSTTTMTRTAQITAIRGKIQMLRDKIKRLKADQEKKAQQIQHIEQQPKPAPESVTAVRDAKITALQKQHISTFPEGYLPVPGSQTALKFGGMVKVDLGYLPGAQSDVAGAFLNIKNIPLKTPNAVGTQRNGHLDVTAQASRFSLDTLTHTSLDDIYTHIEIDFYGLNNKSVISSSATNYTTAAQGTLQSNTYYAVRLRRAYVEFKGFLIGQNDTNFADTEFYKYFLDNMSVGLLPRRPQIRYTYAIDEHIKFSSSLEKPQSDYLDRNGSTWGNEKFGQPKLPEITARLRYEGEMGFVSVGGIFRVLAVQCYAGEALSTQIYNKPSGQMSTQIILNTLKMRRNGWGVSLGAKINKPKELSHIFGQIMYGTGLGYLAEDGAPASYFQFQTNTDLPSVTATGPQPDTTARWSPQFELTRTLSTILGYCHYVTDNFKITLATSFTYMWYPQDIPILMGSTQLNQKLYRHVMNAIYSPFKSLDIGIEVTYAKRYTIKGINFNVDSGALTPYSGTAGQATQILTSIIYKF